MCGVGGALLSDCTHLSHQPLDHFSCLVASEKREALLHNSKENLTKFLSMFGWERSGLVFNAIRFVVMSYVHARIGSLVAYSLFRPHLMEHKYPVYEFKAIMEKV